ncbi:MAG: LacI family DNA-binding transcriptional regulator [Chloroflexi bacterium]|nr:LacI family DNA-binding transcriptional regulator [Chloroflexota bacterium]
MTAEANGRARANDRATIEDVARYANVSTATVSRLLNGTSAVAEETASRIYEAIEQLHYVAHAAARGLASQKHHTIGVIVPDTSSYFVASLLRGITEALLDSQYDTLIFVTPTQVSIQSGRPLPLGEHNTDGLIVFNQLVSDDTLRLLERRGLPLVLLFREPPDESHIPCINFENYQAAYELTEHLIVNCGRRRIAFLRGLANFPDSQWRENGYRQAQLDHGITPDESLIAVGGFRVQLAEQVVQEWMAEGREMDAIFAADDNMAMGAIKALRQAGKSVPDDIAVVGFNDDLPSRYLSPALTTVYAPAEEVGRSAANTLLALMDGQPIHEAIVLPTHLIIRQSCGSLSVPQSVSLSAND